LKISKIKHMHWYVWGVN